MKEMSILSQELAFFVGKWWWRHGETYFKGDWSREVPLKQLCWFCFMPALWLLTTEGCQSFWIFELMIIWNRIRKRKGQIESCINLCGFILKVRQMKHEVVLRVRVVFICSCSSILVVLLFPQDSNLWLLHDHTWQCHVEMRIGYSFLVRHEGDFKIALKIPPNWVSGCVG